MLQLKAAGALVLGKTVTTELAFFGPGKTRIRTISSARQEGRRRDRLRPVADFHAPLALGTQTAGSILRPASYCGVLGFKPTFGSCRAPACSVNRRRSIRSAGMRAPVKTWRCSSMPCQGPILLTKGRRRVRSAVFLQASERRGAAAALCLRKDAGLPQGDANMQRAFEDFVAGLRGDVIEIPLPRCSTIRRPATGSAIL